MDTLDLLQFKGDLQALKKESLMDNPNTSIKIGLTYEDLEDLMADKSFDWTFENVDVHLYNEDENPN